MMAMKPYNVLLICNSIIRCQWKRLNRNLKNTILYRWFVFIFSSFRALAVFPVPCFFFQFTFVLRFPYFHISIFPHFHISCSFLSAICLFSTSFAYRSYLYLMVSQRAWFASFRFVCIFRNIWPKDVICMQMRTASTFWQRMWRISIRHWRVSPRN